MRWLIGELAAWLLLPALFLLVYVGYYGVTPAAVAAHLRVVLLVWCTIALARVAARRIAPGSRALDVAVTLVGATWLVASVLYYGLVIAGLEFWGRVASWALMRSYSIGSLADTLGIPLAVPIGLFIVICAPIVFLTWRHVCRHDWTRALPARLSIPVLAAVLSAGAIGCAAEWYHFAEAMHAPKFEPLSLTFFPESTGQTVQGTGFDRSLRSALDGREEAARGSYVSVRPAVRRNVVLIVVDALRPDHLGVNGYARDTTPNLKRLLERSGVRQIANVHAACAASACGLFSLIGSRFVHRFPSRPFSLQEVLRRHGYKVHMILGGDHENYYGLRKIYGELDSYFDASMAPAGRFPNDDTLVTEKAAALPKWDGSPTMLQFHLMSAHPAGLRQEQYLKYAPHRQYLFRPLPFAQMREAATNYYDAGVLQADAKIAELLQALGAKGYLENTLLVLTADHGEALGEKGVFSHGNGVSEEELRVPLFMIAYGYSPARLADNPAASQVDIAPTILAELGIAAPPIWDGTPLQSRISRAYSFFQERYTAGFIDHRDERAVWKYWIDVRTGEEFAVDLARDPMGGENKVRSVDPKLRREWRAVFLDMRPVMRGASSRRDP